MMNQISIPNHPETETGIFLLEIDKHVSTFKINTHSIQYKGFLKCVKYWKTLKITKIFSTDDHYHDPYLKMKFFPDTITVLCYSAKIVSNSLYFTLDRVIIS